MFPWLAGLTLLVAPGCLFAAPAPKEQPQANVYSPANKGDTWTYEVTTGAHSTEVTQVVSQVERKGDALIVSISQWQSGEIKPYSRVLVSDAGLFRLAGEDGVYKMPFCFLKLPVKPNERWEAETPARKSKFMAGGEEEEVEVPAGKFKALRVESVSDVGNGQIVRATIWYARGVGLVKKTTRSHQSEQVTVLRSFTLAKR